MKRLFITVIAALFFTMGTLSAADPAPKKAPQKCPCTGQPVCKCDKTKNCKCTAVKKADDAKKAVDSKKTEKAKPAPIKKPVSQSIIKRVTNPVLDQQKKRDQQLIDQGLL